MDNEESMPVFLTRIAGKISEANKVGAAWKCIDVPDLERLVQSLCIHEARQEAREQQTFARLCESGAQFYEA